MSNRYDDGAYELIYGDDAYVGADGAAIKITPEIAHMMAQGLHVAPAPHPAAAPRPLLIHVPKIAPDARQPALARAVADPERAPQIFLGVDKGSDTAASTTETITTQPTVEMYLTDFFVDEDIAADFLINNITTGRLNLLASSAGVPASLFLASAQQRSSIELGRVAANTVISISVTNRRTSARRFSAAFQGVDLTARCG